MPIGGPAGGPLRATLTRAALDALAEGLFQRARLPLDAACWQAGVDLNQAMMGLAQRREDMARRGVPSWKQETVRRRRRRRRARARAWQLAPCAPPPQAWSKRCAAAASATP